MNDCLKDLKNYRSNLLPYIRAEGVSVRENVFSISTMLSFINTKSEQVFCFSERNVF